MFDLIATRYDFINRALALNLDIGWRKVMVKEIAGDVQKLFEHEKRRNLDSSDVHFLDLATGTADVAILLAKEYDDHFSTMKDLKRNIHILGVDPSINMITVGREKIQNQKLSEIINLELGDARELTKLPDDKFNAATMSFGIRNVPEKEQALCEIHRVLKKDGFSTLGILEFSEPSAEAGIMGFFARLFIRHIVPAVGAFLSGAPREYMHLQNSIKDFPSPNNFIAMMEGLECRANNDGKSGAFQVKKMKHLNFGSVQLYLATPITK
jgi:demethylmenaquinone methyltransferase/2-methoxy-6-polyprenyl-1,4-benzoquinol methylase